MNSEEERRVHAQAGQVRERLRGLTEELRVVDDEVDGLAPQREHHELLDKACGSLERLGELGAAELFWGEALEPARVTERLREVRDRVGAFQSQLAELDERRGAILAKIGTQEENLEILGEDLYQIREAEERRKLEWIVERETSPLPGRMQLMAWARGGEDDRRFRKSLVASLLVSFCLGALLPLIDLPLPKRFVPDEMPKRLAQLVREEQRKLWKAPPTAPEPPPEQEEPEPVEEPEPPEESDRTPPEEPALAEAETAPSEQPGQPAAETAAVADARPGKTVEKAGILAFRDKFASLAQDKVAPRLGSAARYSDAKDASSASSRSMLTTHAPGSSGGINLASLSRSVGGGGGGDGDGGGGGGIHGVQVGRATSSIAGIGGGGRPQARGGPAAGRTDEEIQIVFDRYKSSFYRLYNRELRRDPTLRGQMVLRLTIEPDGSVSMCALQSSDMDAPDLAAQVVSRVRTLDFGAKDVQALTIVYPIDFLPAS